MWKQKEQAAGKTITCAYPKTHGSDMPRHGRLGSDNTTFGARVQSTYWTVVTVSSLLLALLPSPGRLCASLCASVRRSLGWKFSSLQSGVLFRCTFSYLTKYAYSFITLPAAILHCVLTVAIFSFPRRPHTGDKGRDKKHGLLGMSSADGSPLPPVLGADTQDEGGVRIALELPV